MMNFLREASYMSSNEAVALEANFKSWQEKRFPTPPKDINVFEYYCIDQFLRPYDLSDSQLGVKWYSCSV
jgi:hypothetical protein